MRRSIVIVCAGSRFAYRLLAALLVLVLVIGSLGEGGATHANAAFRSCSWVDSKLRAEELSIAQLVWKRNVLRGYGVVRPSRAYSGVWLRDSFWTLTAIGDPALAAKGLGHFVQAQLPDGHVPTQFATFLRHPVYRADESTSLFLIWSYWIARAGRKPPPHLALQRALGYLRSHAHDGLYISARGDYASWFDSYVVTSADTLSYNQGLYAVALLAARSLGLPISLTEVDAARRGYAALVDRHHHYLRFSRLLAYHDISGLTGEFLALWLFHHALLSDRAVQTTIATQPQRGGGFPVVTDAHGAYLSPHAFVFHEAPGDYQNGASWLLYDYLALGAAALHHLSDMTQRLHDRLRMEFQNGHTYHEYIATIRNGSASPEPRWRDGFSWDTFVLRIDAVLADACTAHAVGPA